MSDTERSPSGPTGEAPAAPATPSGLRRWGRALLLGGAGSILLLLLILRALSLDWRALTLSLAPEAPLALTGALLASALVWLLRGLRVSLLCPSVRLTASLAIVSAQGLLLRVTPLRLGDLGLPVLLERRGVPLAEALLLLFWIRLSELWILAWLCLVALLTGAGGGVAGEELLGQSGSLISALLLLATLPLLARLQPIACALGRAGLAVARGVGLPRRLPKIYRRLAGLQKQLEAAERRTQRDWLILLGGAAAILCAQALLFWCLLRGCGAELSLSATLLGTSLAHLAGALPLPTIGNLGTHELGWVTGLTALGLAAPLALQSALLSQAATLAFAMLWGAWGLLWLRAQRKSSAQMAQALTPRGS